jgi:signal transduction histidine kinase
LALFFPRAMGGLAVFLLLAFWALARYCVGDLRDRYKRGVVAFATISLGMSVGVLGVMASGSQLTLLSEMVRWVPPLQIALAVAVLGLWTWSHHVRIRSLEHALESSTSDCERLEGNLTEQAAGRERAEQERALAEQSMQSIITRIEDDFSGPLSAVRGHIQLVEKLGDDRGVRTQYLKASVDHLDHVLQDLKEHARLSEKMEAPLHPVERDALFAKVQSEAEAVAALRQNRFSLDIQQSVPAVLVLDEKAVRRLISLLIANAALDLQRSVIQLSVESTDACEGAKRLVLRLADTGPGFTAEQLASVTTEQVDQLVDLESNGTRVHGLHRVAAQARAISGALTVHTVLGVGTEVTVELPFVDESSLESAIVGKADVGKSKVESTAAH